METLLTAILQAWVSPLGFTISLGVMALFIYGIYRWVKAPRKAKAGGEEHFTGQPPASAAR